jgi:hypothetical protein
MDIIVKLTSEEDSQKIPQRERRRRREIPKEEEGIRPRVRLPIERGGQNIAGMEKDKSYLESV